MIKNSNDSCFTKLVQGTSLWTLSVSYGQVDELGSVSYQVFDSTFWEELRLSVYKGFYDPIAKLDIIKL